MVKYVLQILIILVTFFSISCKPVRSLRKMPSTPKVSITSIYRKDPTIVAGEATNTVSRDTPGQTELERTIIRWYFDSDPRGARIFWRVVSSIPAVVKNTNESYLMTTPFEETRAFNILGLTYENSRDVQIEIKVSKKGYEDQIKRFNVRQAIDQQEISAFFGLVEKEDDSISELEKDKQVLGEGNTALEKTVINWSVYSSPKGADVYWRILSSTDDVKNTNRNYLGTTPYESTESFDIKGLTFNNSEKVQIEVSCEKEGYLMQKKKFNLRQVLDQKDISTKFNLVAE